MLDRAKNQKCRHVLLPASFSLTNRCPAPSRLTPTPSSTPIRWDSFFGALAKFSGLLFAAAR